MMRLLLLALALISPIESSAQEAPRADHHMHIQSKLITDQLRAMQAADSTIFDGIAGDLFTERTGEDALRELDRAGVDKGVLLSVGYMFGFSAVPMEPAVRAERMRAENRYNVDAALASKGRLVAFVGINPFAPNAFDELDYWARQPGASGIKLHLGNSGFDTADAEQVEVLGRFFAAASEARLPLVVHLRGAAPFSGASVNIFIDKILAQAGDLPVQIAHGGGYAGIDQPTLEALDAYGAAIARRAPGTANLVLDISAVMQFDPTKLPDASTSTEKRSYEEMRGLYVTGMRRIGLDRFVLASDWPALSSVAEYFAREREMLPVTDAEWKQLCGNLAPYLRPGWQRP
jgi:predicted TIM-barrel fold metal-dependent hydrolase